MSRIFISYARADDSQYLRDFCTDLVDDVRSLLGRQTVGGLAFRDTRDVQLGEEWEPAIVQELAGAEVMVCLYSATYFQREHCRKEWTVFRDRIDAHAPAKAAGAPALQIPVIWNQIDPPAAAKVTQFANEKFCKEYWEHGLGLLSRQNDKRSEYTRAVRAVAEAVKSGLGFQPPLPPPAAPLSFDTAPDRFADAAAVTAAAVAAGPTHVRFFVLVSAPAAAPAWRSPSQWTPFHPPSDKRIGPLLQLVASQAGLTSEIVGPVANISQELDQVEENNNLAVLIVDPASALAHTKLVMQYDVRNSSNAALLIAWNPDDPQLATQRPTIERALKQLLKNRLRLKDPTLRPSIQSEDELRTELHNALMQTQRSVLGAADPVSAATEEGGPVLKPVVSATPRGTP